MPHEPLPHDSLAALGGPEDTSLDAPTLLSTTRVPLGAVEILPGLSVSADISLDRRRVRFEVRWHGIAVFRAALDETKLRERWTGNQGLLKEDVEFDVDLAAGELRVSGDVCVRAGLEWSCRRITDHVLLAWSPTLGAVGGSVEAHAPVVIDPAAGPSRGIVPTITRIPVERAHRVGTAVGAIVKETFFADVPDFLFNVCFSVGDFPLVGPGTYGDPESLWFNVFAGYYQIDCPKPAWDRPFGYDISGAEPAVRFDEILRLGKADWNYFSNWMYGVPEGAVRPFDVLDPEVRGAVLARHVIGASAWDLVDLDGFSAVTAYVSGAPGAGQLVDNSPLSPMWRLTYGHPAARSGYPESFFGSKMRARLYMAYQEDEAAYHTLFFGGTINKAFDGPDNDALLEAQMEAARGIIAAHYPALGFPA